MTEKLLTGTLSLNTTNQPTSDRSLEAGTCSLYPCAVQFLFDISLECIQLGVVVCSDLTSLLTIFQSYHGVWLRQGAHCLLFIVLPH